MKTTKITPNGVALLSGTIKTCMAKRGEEFSCEQLELTSAPKILSLEKFRQIFPLELGTAERLVAFARSMEKENLDEESVALFFSGEEHILYALNDISEKGIRNGLAKLLLIFHLMLPMKIGKEKKGGYFGTYFNQGREIFFKNIQILACDKDKVFDFGLVYFVHYGYIVGVCKKKICESVLEEQIVNKDFSDACSKIITVDCAKILSAFHLLKK